MSLCDEYREHFAAILSLGRGVGTYVPPPPSEPIPEGCDLSPCANPSSAIVNAMTTYRAVMTDFFARAAGGCGTGCSAAQSYSRSNYFGPWQPVIENKCVRDVPPGGCAQGSGFYYLTDDLSCPLPPPPSPPSPPVYDEPIAFLVEPTPTGGWSVTSPTNVWPSPEWFQSTATDYQCICDNLFKIFKILQQQFPTAYFQQQNVISEAEQRLAGFKMLAEVLQYAVADITGREPRLVNSNVVTVPTVQEVVLPNP